MNAQQLKNAILQEAIEGRLVPQDPNDEPASALLARIRKEKEQLVKAGKLKKKDLEVKPISEDEIPFEIPESWEWVRVEDVIYPPKYGTSNKSLPNGSVPVLRMGNIQDGEIVFDKLVFSNDISDNEKYNLTNGDLLFNRTNSAELVGKTGIYRGQRPAIYAGYLILLRPIGIHPDYLNYVLGSSYARSYCKEVKTIGVQQCNINAEKISSFIIPLPPLAEQKRIVAKIEELLPKVEEYGKAQDALNKLNAELPERLKKSILQEAIEGRLVPQDPNDETASVLLDKIQAEKKRLVKEGKLKKKDLEVKPISEDEIPFEIPESWEWVRIESLFNHSSGKQLSAADTEGTLKEYITTSNLYWDRFELDNLKSMYYKDSELERCTAKKGDLLVCEGGDVGRSAIWPYDYDICLQNHVHRLRPYNECYTRFVYFVIWFYKIIGDIGGKGIGIKGLSASALKSIVLPIPPLAEQHRIVEKLEQVLGEIDKLKK